MSTENQYGQTTGTSQTGSTTGRSAEYDDSLTVQDTSHSAKSGEDRSLGQRAAEVASSVFGGAPDGTKMASLTSDETGKLISADKVQGTAVYDAAGERLGTIDSIMLGKQSGRVAYAVMSFGGFLGIGERYHPLPWNVLTYDESKGGYNIQHSADDMRRAPNYSRDEVSDFDYGARHREIDDYYGVDVGAGGAGLGAGRAY